MAIRQRKRKSPQKESKGKNPRTSVWTSGETNTPHAWLMMELLLLLLLLLLSWFSHVQLCATSETAAHQALPSLGFSRQEHWSGLPFPSLKHESEKWKSSCCLVLSLDSPVLPLTTPWTAAYKAPPSMRFSRQEYWSGVPLPSFPTSNGLVE